MHTCADQTLYFGTFDDPRCDVVRLQISVIAIHTEKSKKMQQCIKIYYSILI